MVNEYYLKYENILKHAKNLIYYWMGFILFCIGYSYFNGMEESFSFLLIFAIISIIVSAPLVTLFVTYYVLNRNVKLIDDKSNSKISIFYDNKWDTFSYTEIILFERNLSRSKFRDDEPFYFWETVNYVKIELVNGKRYFITCFVADLFDISISDEFKTKRSKVLTFIY